MYNRVFEKNMSKKLKPQNNGDIFAFNADLNKAFMHGIPKANSNIGERFSIIAWGCQKHKS